MGEPGIVCLTLPDLPALFVTLPTSVKENFKTKKLDVTIEYATLSGSPGNLLHESYEFSRPNLSRARLMEADVPGHANGRTDGVNPALFPVL